MGRKHRRRSKRSKALRLCLSVCAVVLVLAIGIVGAQVLESRMSVKVENAGMQMTAHTREENTAQVFMNNQWYRKKDVETLLVMGVDNSGSFAVSDSYNNDNQADFLVLFVRDLENGTSAAIHLNRDTMTDITVLGVTGQVAGTRHAQLALAYNYGRGENDSSRNAAEAVSNLLYGMKVDHYITVTMTAVEKMNEWVGGVEVEVLDDFTGIDASLIKGEKVRLRGAQALTYVRTRKGLEESTNLRRMERQRQYAAAWLKAAEPYLKDEKAVAELMVEIGDYHYSDCNAEKMAEIAAGLSENPDVNIYELPGEAVKGNEFMEYYADEEKIQELVLQLFFEPVKE